MDLARRDSCALYFKELSNCINKGNYILNNVSGKFKSGSLVAVLGPSGSGKSTFLNILSGYRYQNATCDALLFNNTHTTFEHLADVSCYLTQDIHLNDLLSIEENMHFVANFKFGTTRSQVEKNSIISEILDCFGLASSRETRAGQLSGGERKRLALALEMVSNPQLIFLDEPTTGLDIVAAHKILEYLKKITTSGKTVICSIHQPCASHFYLFDLAYVIVDGKCAFQGRPQDLVPFLNTCGLPCNIYHNPADYLLELCCGHFGKDKVNHLVKKSQNGATNIEPHLLLGVTPRKNYINHLIHDDAKWKYTFKALMHREYLKMSRNWVLTYMRILQNIFISLAIGIIFSNVGEDASKILFNYNWVTAIASANIFTGLLCPILSFPMEMNIIKRELHNRYYSLLQYYVTISLLDLPVSIITFVSSGLISYYLSGQSTEVDRVVLFMIFIVILGNVANAIGFFFGTLCISFNFSLILCLMTQIPMLAISGFVIRFHDLSWILEKLSLGSYGRAGLQGCLIAIFGLTPRKLPCPEEKDYCFYKEPHRLLLELDIDPYNYSMCVYVLIIWLITVRIITYYSMRYRLTL